jgi:DNA-directed RNA polymerase subunit omega
MNELLSRVPSRYMLVNIAANRARKISSESQASGIPLTEKPVSLAVQEIANGTLIIDLENETVEAAD